MGHDSVGPRSGRVGGDDVATQIYPWGGHVSLGGNAIGFTDDAVPGEFNSPAERLGRLQRDAWGTVSSTAGASTRCVADNGQCRTGSCGHLIRRIGA